MEYKSVKGFGGWAQLGFLFAFLGLGFILTGGVQFLLTMQIMPAGKAVTDGDAMMKAMLAPENVGMARIIQVLGTLALLFIPAVLWSIVSNGKNIFWLGFNKYVNGFQILLGFMLIYAAAISTAPLGEFTKYIVGHFPTIDAMAKKMEDLYNQQALALMNLKNWQEYVVGLFIMAFFPAMFEEVFFRGAVQNLFTKWWKNPFVAILVTSIIFSFIHMSIYLFLSRLVLGFVLGLMFHITRNIWVNIIAHFLNNAIALTGLFVMSTKNEKLDLAKLEPSVHWSIGLAGVIALVGLFMMLKKYSAKNKARIDMKENLLIEQADPYRSFANNQNN
ncbi:MAG: CPBP family intramembrane metalloprotease [Ferruginibacter sp.]|nr:CPBP family intramembrane metalloprotease [Ferruginibacter sp.]